jgi:hypothetical protein
VRQSVIGLRRLRSGEDMIATRLTILQLPFPRAEEVIQ